MSMELIQRAFDSNAFLTSQTEAGYVNPEYWDTQMMDHVRTKLVVLPLGRDVTSRFPGDGDTFNLTILSEPAMASSVAETASVSIVQFAPTQAILSPSEHGIAYEVSDKEMRRAFFPVMEQFTRDLGYGIAKQVDKLCVTEITTSAGNSVVANGVASSAIASSDTLDHIDVINAMKANAIDLFEDHMALVLRPEQHADLSKDSTFLQADAYGPDRAANRNGMVGSVFGIPVYSTTQIAVSSSTAKALLISAPDAFAYIFRTPQGGAIRTDYIALLRQNQLVGVVDFDVVTTRANAICTIETYCA